MPHPALTPDAVAVVTGGASGIGLAAGDPLRRPRAPGLHRRSRRRPARRGGRGDGRGVAGRRRRGDDGGDRRQPARRSRSAGGGGRRRFGGTDVLMNNAGIGPGTGVFGPLEAWKKMHGHQPLGRDQGSPGLRAGHDRPRPAGTGDQHRLEAGHHHAAGQPRLQHLQGRGEGLHRGAGARAAQRRGCRITAHLLIPGFVFTGLTAGDRREKPAAAWTPEQTVDFLLERIDAGDFYILCPDNDVPRALDERRILWAAGDMVENRPPLSRWHPDYAEAFAEFIKDI